MKKIVGIILTIVILAGICTGAYFYVYFMPIHVIERAFEDKDYEKVVEVYSKLEDSSDREKVRNQLLDIAKDYYDDYLDEAISYEDISEYFELVESVLKKESDYKDYLEDIDEIYESRNNYNLGIDAIETSDFLLAISYFELVSDIDEKYVELADEKIIYCQDSYVTIVIEEADGYLDSYDYVSALEVIEDALSIFPKEQRLLDYAEKLKAYTDVENVISYCATYDLGDLIASEMGIYGYDVYFPAVLIVAFEDSNLSVYVDPESIKPALDAMTADDESMKALYSIVEDYGFSQAGADMLISLTYGGSYSDFIYDYFGTEIDEALSEFTFHTTCFRTVTNIYIGTDGINDNNYLTCSIDGDVMTIESYTGNSAFWKQFEYPILLKKI